MPRLDIKMRTGPGVGTSIGVYARRLRDMNGRAVKDILKRHLEAAARPYPMRARASALAIPVKPEGRHTGLRARIAGCVTLSSGTDADSAYASVWVNPFKMLPDYVTLPLYMEGVTTERTRYRHDYSRWRHPVFGDREVWVSQDSHPYFYQATASLGRAAVAELQAALEDINRKLEA
jgi:hypothetical protein